MPVNLHDVVERALDRSAADLLRIASEDRTEALLICPWARGSVERHRA
jgi:hypothetical protein